MDIAKAAPICAGITPKRSTIPIIANVAIRDGWLYATDTSRSIAVRLDDCDALSGVCVDAQQLKAALANARDGRSLLPAKGGGIAVKWTGGSTSIRGMTIDDFPFPQNEERAAGFVVDAKAWGNACAACLTSASTEEARYYLCGARIEVDGDAIVMTSTDGHRLTTVRIDVEDISGEISETIPRETLGLMNMVGAERLSVALSQRSITVSGGDLVVTSRLVGGSYPDWQRAVPRSDGATKIELQADEMVAIARQIMPSTGPEGGHTCALDIGSSEVALEAENDISETRIVVTSAEIAASECRRIGFNARYLSDAFGLFDEAGVTVHATNPAAPILIEHGAMRAVVMPQRI